MRRETIPNGWYAAAAVNGWYAVLVPPLQKIATHGGLMDYPKLPDGTPDEPLFLDITTARGDFNIAGKGHGSLNSWELVGWTWNSRPHACGNFSVIFDLAGWLHISNCEPGIGVQGWRCAVADGTPQGRLLTGDETYGPYRGLTEWSPITDDLTIGQGWDGGGVQLWDRGVMRVLETGPCYAVKRSIVGQNVAIAFYRDIGGAKTAFLVWATVAELRTLPVLNPAPIPPNPEPEPPPVSTDYLGIVQRVRRKYPTPLGARHWEFLVDVAQQTGTLLYKKDGGTRIFVPPLGQTVSQDIVGRGTLGDNWADILGDAEGAAVPSWDVHPNAAGTYLDVAGIALPGEPQPPQPPATDCPKRVAQLEAALRQIRSIADGVL
jgi:hypothetical protein